jgi:hypothetical protein
MGHVFHTKDPDTKPYWTKYSKRLSKSFWLPTKSKLRKSINKVSKITKNTWFSSSIKMYKSSMSNIRPNKRYLTEIKDSDHNLVTKSIKISPTTKQTYTLLQWFGISRLCYNYTIRYLKYNKMESFYSLRKKIYEQLKVLYPYIVYTPFDLAILASFIAFAQIAYGV